MDEKKLEDNSSELPQNTPEPLGVYSNNPSKSKKTLRIAAIVIFLVIISGVIVYLYLQRNESAENASSIDPTPQIEIREQGENSIGSNGSGVFVFKDGQIIERDGDILQRLEDTGSDLASELPTVGVITDRNELEPTSHTMYLVTDEGQTELLNNTESIYLRPSLAPDGSKVVYFADKGLIDYATFHTSAYIAIIDTDGASEPRILLDRAWNRDAGHGPLLPLGWASDNRTVYLRDNSCLECHGGGPSSGLYSLDTETGDLAYLFGAYESNDLRSFYIAEDSNKIISIFDDYDYYANDYETVEDTEATSFNISIFDTATKASETLYIKENASDTQPRLIGWSLDRSQILININNSVADEDLSFRQVLNRVLIIDITSGETQEITAGELVDGDHNRITQAVLSGDVLHYVLAGPDNDDTFGPDSYRLYSYERGNSTKTLITERTDSIIVQPINVD